MRVRQTYFSVANRTILFLGALFLVSSGGVLSEDFSVTSTNVSVEPKMALFVGGDLVNDGGVIMTELRSTGEQDWQTKAGVNAYFDESTIQYIVPLSVNKDIYVSGSEEIIVSSLVSFVFVGAEAGVNGSFLHSRLNISKTWDDFVFFSGIRFPILNGVSDSISLYSGDLDAVFGCLGVRYMIQDTIGVTAAYYRNNIFLGVILFDIPFLFNMSNSSAKSTYLDVDWYN
ncbi:hypothetical protein HOH45_04680 [bacterium]|jgi:hypothetical protein|nr:hypothetical protein [bacterium]